MPKVNHINKPDSKLNHHITTLTVKSQKLFTQNHTAKKRGSRHSFERRGKTDTTKV